MTSVGQSVGRLVNRSICHNFQKRAGEVTLPIGAPISQEQKAREYVSSSRGCQDGLTRSHLWSGRMTGLANRARNTKSKSPNHKIKIVRRIFNVSICRPL